MNVLASIAPFGNQESLRDSNPAPHQSSRSGGQRRKSRKRRNQLRYRRLAVEGLEDRSLLAVVSLIPVKDNTLIKDTSTTLGSTSNGAGDIFVGLNNEGNRTKRGLIEFDVAGSVPADATINSVALTMWVNRNQSRTTMNVELHKVLAEWGEAGSSGKGPGGPAQTGDATWLNTFYPNQTWAKPGGDFSGTVSGAQSIGLANASYTWSSTAQMVADVQAWLDDPAANHGWILLGNETSRSSHRFDSRTSSNAAHRPTLTIDYTVAAPTPDIAISDVTIAEGNSGTTSAIFDVTLSAASSQSVTVNYATTNGTAIAGADYQTTSGTLTFSPGQTAKTISVPVIGESLVELNETFSVNLSGTQNANLADSQGIGTINNDDSASLSINDVTLAEGNGGTTPFSFTVTLNAAVDAPVSVGYSTANGTAMVADSDYTAASGTLNFTGNAGETKTVSVQVNGDQKFEPDETFLVNLTNLAAGGRNVTLADSQGTGTITNDDTINLPALTISDATLVEGNAGTATVQFDVQLSAVSSDTVTVDFGTADGTAVAGADYQAASGSLTFLPGETLKSITVTVTGDTVVELDESFLVNLNSPQNAVLADPQGDGTIANDDSATLSIDDVTLAEGNSGTTNATFTVTLSAAVDVPVSVDFSTANGTATTADNDYTSSSGKLTFAGSAGETQTVSVTVNGDQKVELDETVLVNLANIAASGRDVTFADAQGVGTITDDDAVLNTVTLTPHKDNTLIENASGSLSNGAGDIFVGQNNNGNLVRRGLLAFDVAGSVPAGATIQSVTLTMYVTQTQVGDYAVELHKVLADWGEAGSTGSGTGGLAQSGDATWLHQFYDSQLWSVPGGDFSPTASGVQAIGTQGVSYTWDSTAQMVDDVQSWLDNPDTDFGWLLQADETQNSAKRFASRESSDPALRPTLTIAYVEATPPDISIKDVIVTEGDSGATVAQFSVTLSAPSSSPIAVDYATADGSATAGSDYLAATGTVTFAPNETTQTISITVNGDTQVEPDETFFVNLSNPTGATIADSQGVGIITNDDSAAQPTLSISDVTRAEGNDGTTSFTFTVTLNGAAGGPLSVDFATVDGTATAGNGTTGDTTTDGGTTDTDDDQGDGNQADDQDDSQTGDPETDDQGDGARGGEDGEDEDQDGTEHGGENHNGAEHSGEDSEHDHGQEGDGEGENCEHSGGSGNSAGDYAPTSGTLHFTGAAGETQTITVYVHGDTQVEPDETFFVQLSNAVGAMIADGQGTGTITNDDTTTVRQRPWQNPRDHHDVNDKDGVTPLDALMLINYINDHPGQASLPASDGTSPPYYDVSGDDACTAMDVLQVINRINQSTGQAGGEGEAVCLALAPAEPILGVSPESLPWPDTGESGSAARPANPLSAQQDSQQSTPSASAGLGRTQTNRAWSRSVSRRDDRVGDGVQESPFNHELDFSELEGVLSVIGQDVGRAWKRPDA